VLHSEIDSAFKIPEGKRVFYKQHIINDDGEGEPHPKNEEIIIQ
jgi:hypothetical protein